MERKIVGIDLAGKEKNPTGFCVLTTNEKDSAEVTLVYTDEEIIRNVEIAKPTIICIDAPLSMPRKGEYFRKCDREMISRGYRVLSPRIPSMLILVERGIQLAKRLRELGYRCIEVFPRATERILGLEKERRVNQDKYDALLCALTGKCYLNGKYEAVGDEEGIIIIPSTK